MLWSEVRKTYPDKWVVFDGLKQYDLTVMKSLLMFMVLVVMSLF